MSSNKLFRAANLVHRSGQTIIRLRSLPCVPSTSSVYRDFSTKNTSSGSNSGEDLLLRARGECVSLLIQHQQRLASKNYEQSRKRSQAAPAIRELDDDWRSSNFTTVPILQSSLTPNERDEKRLEVLRKRFQSRLNTYLQACILVASQDTTKRKLMQIAYLDAACKSLTHYVNRSKNGYATCSLDDPELFNTVLFGFAHAHESVLVALDGRRRSVALLGSMAECNMKPNEGTLAAFYLLSKLPVIGSNSRSQINEERNHEDIMRTLDHLLADVAFNWNFLHDPRLTDKDREILMSLDNCAIIGNFRCIGKRKLGRYRQPLLESLNEPYYAGSSFRLDENLDKQSSESIYASVFDNIDELKSNIVLQWHREKQGIITVPSVLADSGSKVSVQEQVWNEIQRLWREQLCDAFDKEKERCTIRLAQRRKLPDTYQRIDIAPFLCLVESRHYVDIMFNEAVRLLELGAWQAVSYRYLCLDLGRKLMDKVKIDLAERYGVTEKLARMYEQYIQYFIEWDNYERLNHREYWQEILDKLGNPSSQVGAVSLTCDNDWLVFEIGEFLFNVMINYLKVPNSMGEATKAFRTKKKLDGMKMVDAFFKARSAYGEFAYEQLRPHETLLRLKDTVIRRELKFDIKDLPMLCPPIPLHKDDEGQMLIRPFELVRLEPRTSLSIRPTIGKNGSSAPAVLDALNALGATPWMINQPVLDVMLQVFRGDGDVKLDIPPSRDKLPSVPSMPKGSLSLEEKSVLFKQRQTVKKHRAETYSLWSTAHYRFSIANYFRGKILWFPHNLDFRGRTYPVPSLFNHMGDDVCRGMMMFAKGRPLGEGGLRLLKIHCINLTALKKRDSLDDRAKYADEIIEDILDSARNPLNGKRWWMKSEEPWQTLAVCMEIEKAMRADRPEEYVCHMPVHQDGSCNGLQHYAALGRDKLGAIQVNLEPSETPQDVYSAVAELIEQKRARDAEAGLEIAQVLNGFVRRKVIKQTVMTTVYGVTRYGGKEQIRRQLNDIDEFPKEYVFKAAAYLVERLFESIGEIFTAARDIQVWFVKSAGIISGALGRTMEWETPLGFRVAQPYFKPVHTTSATDDRLWESTSKPISMYYVEKPNTLKQKNAFPPNYIHSLDSTHMMLTALHCQRQGVTYAAVHDSFWTHPCAVADMNRICREQFVALHSQPLLKDLSNFFIHFYVRPDLSKLRLDGVKGKGTNRQMQKKAELLNKINEHFQSLPEIGNFQLENVNDSPYFFN